MNQYLKFTAAAVLTGALTISCLYFGLKSVSHFFAKQAWENSTAVGPIWQIYEEPLFTVEFPSLPNLASVTGQNARDQGFVQNDLYSSHDDTRMFILQTGELIPSSDTTEEAMITHSSEAIKTLLKVKISTSSEFEYMGNRALRIDYEDTVNGEFVKTFFIYWDGSKKGFPNRYYNLSELSKDGVYTDGDFDHFINSFKINE